MLQNRGTREAIVRAALESAAEGAWESTSLQAVRQRADVSNGSLFHHFRTRQDLTAAVVGAALEDHQAVLLPELGDDAEQGIAGAVRRHVRWVEENRAVARLLLSAPPEVLRRSVSTPVLDGNRHFFSTVACWLRRHGWRERPPLPVVLALWIGPAQEYSRQHLAWDDGAPLAETVEALAAGAWAALRPLLHDTPPSGRTRT